MTQGPPGGGHCPTANGPDGGVWVSDTGHNRIVEFSPHGAELRAFGSPGSGNGQLDQPQDLAAAPGGDIYVADQANNRIEVFSASGGYLASISVPTPYGVTLGASGDLWVSSPSYAAGNAVYEFSATGSQLREFGSTQSGYGALSNPGGLAVGPGGRIYVAQPDYGWVTVFNPDGSFHTEFGLQANVGHASEDLAFPQDLAITASGQAWVADSGNGRIVEFAPPGSASVTSALLPPGGAPAPGGAGVPRGAWWALVIGLGGLGLIGERLRRHRSADPALPATSGTAAPAPAGPQTPALGGPQTPALPGPQTPALPGPQAPAPAATASGTAALLSVSTGPVVTRRRLLTSATAMAGAGFGAAVLPLNLRKALVETLANPPKARLTDIKNIVILMQENRSFDHYFGTMPGVRGFSDPTAWKAGGFVCSDVFDHTSLIRFIEARFGVREPNISTWRRQTCGDLTSAFRFSAQPARYPYGNTRLQLAAAEAGLLAAQQEVNDNPAPAIPAVNQPLPRQ